MADNEVNIVITATDKASQVITGIVNIFNEVSQAVTKLTGDYIDYGDQVQQLSRFIGTSSEESSRMIQLADDAFVSFETLRMASKKMATDGLSPTVENIGKLSDQFLALQPGLARSQFLVDRFGRSGIEMAKIMELGSEKIQQMNNDISDYLILTQEEIENINLAKREVDKFNDAITELRYMAAGKLLEIFKGMPEPIRMAMLGLGAVGQSGMLNSLAQMAIILGNMGKMGAVGTVINGLALSFKGLAVSIWAALAPLWPIIIALGVLYATLKIFGPDAWKTIQMIGAIGMTPFLSAEENKQSWVDRGLISPNAGQSLEDYKSGSLLPTGGGKGAQGATFVYSPTVSLADKQEAETKLKPYIEAAMRGYLAPGR